MNRKLLKLIAALILLFNYTVQIHAQEVEKTATETQANAVNKNTFTIDAYYGFPDLNARGIKKYGYWC